MLGSDKSLSGYQTSSSHQKHLAKTSLQPDPGQVAVTSRLAWRSGGQRANCILFGVGTSNPLLPS